MSSVDSARSLPCSCRMACTADGEREDVTCPLLCKPALLQVSNAPGLLLPVAVHALVCSRMTLRAAGGSAVSHEAFALISGPGNHATL